MIKGLVSILVPVFNGENYLEETLDSLCRQTYPQIEIIVINDGSTDGSKAVVNHFLNDHRVKYYEQPNGGVSSARNKGIIVSSGEYIALCDCDDVWNPYKAEKQVSFLNDHTDAGLVYSNFSIMNAEGRIIESNPIPSPAQGKCFRSLYLENTICASSAMWRRFINDNILMFDEEIHTTEDCDLWLRIASQSKIGYLDENLVHYRLHGQNSSLNRILHFQNKLVVAVGIQKKVPNFHELVDAKTYRLRLYRVHRWLARTLFESKAYSTGLFHFTCALYYAPIRTIFSLAGQDRVETIKRLISSNNGRKIYLDRGSVK